ncbi:MAG: DUF2202 domain-containing protein [Saprospiraceae bacterium]|nr:DUF2202 domain-containing protein [Saprospiraceae bacterium]
MRSLIFVSIFIVGAFAMNAQTNQPANSTSGISLDEQKTLVQIFEQEKMARDVYTQIGEKFGIKILKNAAIGKQKQMSQILDLLALNQANIAFDDAQGVFRNAELTEHYNAFLAEGLGSLNNAFRVGAKMEDYNIYQIDKVLSSTTNDKLVLLFSKLSCSSGNELKTQVNMLVGNGEMFMPDYISVKLYRSIMHDNHEYCGNNM